MNDPIIPDVDEQTQQVRALNSAQVDAQGSNYAEQAGMTGPSAPKQAQTQASWGELVKDHPVLSSRLVIPDFARAAKDDVPQLSKIERIFGGWDEMLWKSKLDLESDTRNQRLSAIGRAQKAGTATPEMMTEGDELEKEAASVKEPNIGFVPGIVPSVVGVLPGLARAAPQSAIYWAGGVLAGSLLGGPKVGAAAAGGMAAAGLTVGMALDTARTEEGLAYRQYIKAGADPKTAGVAADLVALANGGLQAIPVEKVFNVIPGISNLLAGKKTRDLVGSLITSNTGRAALQRFALRAGESGLLMALIGGGQELVRELGAIGAGADDQLHGGRIWDSATGGFQQGLGFGIGHSIAPFIQEKREAQIGLARGEMYKAIGNEAANSKLREQMPEAFKSYVNAVIAEHGNVEETKAPAEAVTALLQKEGITEEKLQADMPEVAKQLRESNNPKDEVVIRMADLATHLAPLKSFPEFSQDLRVGDDALTPRESKKIGELADKFEQENPAKEEEPAPGRKVFDDVYEQLTKAGQAPEVARHDAALWAAFATARGERLGVDPFEYYKQRSVSIGAEFPGVQGEKTLGQPSDLEEMAGKIEDFGTELKKTLVTGADIPDDQLDQFLASEKTRKTGKLPTEEEINAAIAKAKGFTTTTLEQPAYHGSPHRFDKFTLDHIGTGEGAQAYGYGLYFAESEDVADYYRNKLSGEVEIKETAGVPEWKLRTVQEYLTRAVQHFTTSDDPQEIIDAAIKDAQAVYDNGKRQGAEFFDTLKAIEELKKMKPDDIKVNRGAKYEVDIPEKKDLLDYDKPLDKQPPEVLKKLRKAGLLEASKKPKELLEAFLKTDFAKSFSDSSEVRIVKRLLKDGDEEEIKQFIADKMKDSSAAITNTILKDTGVTFYERLSQKLGSDRAASEALHAAGIPGLKYLDQNSRGPHVEFFGEKPGVMSAFGGEILPKLLQDINRKVVDGQELEQAFKSTVNDLQAIAKTADAAKAELDAAVKEKGEKRRDTLNPQFLNMKVEAAGAKDTSARLAKATLAWIEEKGITAKDFDAHEGTHNFVIWDENAIKTLNVLEQRGGVAGSEGYRGKISFNDTRSYLKITLTGKANLSTFLHESGHAFFEFMRKDAESGHAQSQEDFGKLLEWMGLKPGEQPSNEQLEQFARGFEGYLMEGKAPAPELRGLFRTFSSWLKQVYKGIKSLGVNLTDEVRGVMDRMLATDKEIEKAKAGLGLEPMKKPEGMTDAEYTAYTEKFGKAMEAGRNELEERALKEFRNTIGEERAKTQADVEEKTKQDPAHNAYEALRTGKRLDGGEVPEELKKLDRTAVAEAGHKGIKWASITTAEGGLDPDIAAPMLGYKDGPELLDALEARRSRSKEIKEETDKRMMDKYPNADIAKMSEQAVKALHLKDDVGNVLWLEAKALGKQIGTDTPRTAKAVVKEIARRRTEELTALEMQPGRFARGEERAAGEWADAMKSKDFAEAHRAKLDQILNHEMFKSVSAAKDEIDSIRNYLDGFNELPTRRRMGKAGQSYLNAIDAIISDIELKRQTNKTLTRRASLESYLQEMEDNDGALITIPQELRSEASLKNYKQMTLEDLRTVHDAVANIEAMARLKNKIFDGRERRNFQETAIRLATTAEANLGNKFAEKKGSPQNPGFIAQKMEMLRKSAAEMKKIEFIARALDGGETAGWVHSVIFQPFATADAKRMEWTKKVTDQLFKPLRELSIRERAEFDKTVDFLGTPMKLRDVIAVALNMGNEGNKKKLLEGYAYRGWNEEKVTQRLGELLKDKHVDLIEHFWKTIGSLWPEIKALSERTTGVAPPKVEPAKLVINGRELEGGYYPIVYDRDRSYKAEQIAQRKGDLFENNFLKPGVSKGFTETRTQFVAPMLLSLNVIPAHLNEVIHYLTHLEPVRAVDRLMAHPEVRKAVTGAMGKDVYNLFRPWLQAIAHDGAVSENTTTLDHVLRHLRIGASVTRLGFRLTNSIMQGFNILSSVKELGGALPAAKYLTLGMKTWMTELESMRDPFGPVHDQSPEIRGKTEKYETNLIGNFNHFTSAFSEFGHYKDQLSHFAMSFMTLAWKSVESLTWYAAREKAFEENHPRPNEYADSVVRLSQMGEGMKDKAAIMRGGEGTKIFTYMYSWYSTIFNQMTETQPQARGGWQKAGELASRYFWMILAPSVLMSFARGKHAKNDDGEVSSEGGYLAGEVALETAKSLLGPIGGVAADTLLSGHDAKFAPWISTVLRALAIRGKLAVSGGDHQLTDHEKKDLFESTGIMSHLPAGAMYNALKYVSAVQDGKLEEPVRDLLFRSPGDWK